jgi:hypothetical protein
MPDFCDKNDCSDEEGIKQKILSLLIEQKGYSRDDIIVDKEFDIIIDNEIRKSSVDLLITLQKVTFMIIRCARGSLVTREREILSCARILDSYLIPFSVVTNGEDAQIIDSASGEIIGHGLDSIPAKPDALEILEKIELHKLALDRIEKEKRIFLAFDALKCPTECN